MKRWFAGVVGLALGACAHEAMWGSWGSMQFVIRRTDASFSQELKDRYAGQHLHGDYAVTTAPDGRVTDVRVVKSIPGCDESITYVLGHSRFADRPAGMHIELVFDRPATGAGYRAIPDSMFDHLAIERAAPPVQPGVRGSGSYMVYVEADGTVSRVDVVQSTGNADAIAKATFMRWKFQPSGERIRGVLRLDVDLR